jgi:hypothetical protein
MKHTSLNFRSHYLIWTTILISLLSISCTYKSEKTGNYTTADSTVAISTDSANTNDTTSKMSNDSSKIISDTIKKINRNPASVSVEVIKPKPASNPEQVTAKGYAMVYCPTRMIRNVPSIVNAVISKEEMAAAYAKFSEKIQKENPDRSKQKISLDIKGDSIDIYEKMGVTIEFDPEDFKEISKNNGEIKEFKNKNELEWEWILKPLHSTEKSILNFKFFYIDPDNKENYILEKTISISATVDARSYFDRLKDFLSDDPKTLLTVIIIPLVTFLGGFLFGKKKSTKS